MNLGWPLQYREFLEYIYRVKGKFFYYDISTDNIVNSLDVKNDYETNEHYWLTGLKKHFDLLKNNSSAITIDNNLSTTIDNNLSTTYPITSIFNKNLSYIIHIQDNYSILNTNNDTDNFNNQTLSHYYNEFLNRKFENNKYHKPSNILSENVLSNICIHNVHYQKYNYKYLNIYKNHIIHTNDKKLPVRHILPQCKNIKYETHKQKTSEDIQDNEPINNKYQDQDGDKDYEDEDDKDYEDEDYEDEDDKDYEEDDDEDGDKDYEDEDDKDYDQEDGNKDYEEDDQEDEEDGDENGDIEEDEDEDEDDEQDEDEDKDDEQDEDDEQDNGEQDDIRDIEEDEVDENKNDEVIKDNGNNNCDKNDENRQFVGGESSSRVEDIKKDGNQEKKGDVVKKYGIKEYIKKYGNKNRKNERSVKDDNNIIDLNIDKKEKIHDTKKQNFFDWGYEDYTKHREVKYPNEHKKYKMTDKIKGYGSKMASWGLYLINKKEIKNVEIPDVYLTEDKNVSLRGMFIIYKSNGNNLQPIEWYKLFSKDATNEEQYDENSTNKIKRYVVFSLMILNTDKNSDSHCNLLIFDRLLKTVERFEPHGIMIQWDDSFIDTFINNNILNVLDHYTYFPPYSYQSLYGPQAMQFFYSSDNIDINNLGFCSTWCSYYLHFRMLNPNLPSPYIIKLLTSKPYSLTDNIMRYQSYIDDIIH